MKNIRIEAFSADNHADIRRRINYHEESMFGIPITIGEAFKLGSNMP